MSNDTLSFPVEKDKLVDPAMYTAKVVDIQKKQGPKSDYLMWNFEIVGDEEFEGQKVNGITSVRMTPKSAGYKWVCAILGLTEVEEGEMLPVGACIGKTCRVSVDTKDGKDGAKFSNVDKVYGKKKKATTEEAEPVAKKKAAVEEEEDEEPVKLKKKAPVEEEEDEPVVTKKKAAPVEEDEEEVEPVVKKKAKPAEDDEDEVEPVATKKKAKLADEDDDDIF